MAKTVVILGASFAGLKVAHHLLKTTLPVVKDLKVILVAPTTHLLWNLATPRAIVPGQIPDEKILAPYAPAFSKYPSSSYEFVVGKATNVDPTNKSVEVETESGTQAVAYDILVVTTGSNTGSTPWKQAGSHKEFLERLHETQERVKNAKSIILGGSGVTGVETAGELGFEYGKTKEITLISKDDTVLSNFLSPKIGTNALQELYNRNVKVVFNKMVTSTETLPSGQTEITLSTGDKMLCDLYIPCVGVQPNTSFMPKSLLNAQGSIMVDDHLAVKGTNDIWSCGDAADIQGKKVMYVAAQAGYLGASLHTVLTTGKKAGEPYKPTTMQMGVVTVGRAKGFGQMGYVSLPSFVAMFVKGKTMMVENLPKAISGAF